MIKGCSKKVIVMHDTGCDMIEEAFFILKAGAETGKVKQGDIIKHAQRILKSSEQYDVFSPMGVSMARCERRSGSFQFIFGLVSGVICAIIIMLII